MDIHQNTFIVKKAIIDEYCSVYDDFQKIKFIQRIPELIVNNNTLFETCAKDIKLSETEYKLLEKKNLIKTIEI